jgi:CheY-like chemotaxis protein
MMPAYQHNIKPRSLVIEDDPLLQMIHRNLLSRMGFDVVVVGDAESAIQRWDEHWDLVFSDIGLPGMSGNDLCRKRREFEQSAGLAHTPSFAYSAFGSTIKDECLDAGFDAFGVKPMDNSDLFILLQKLLPQFKLVSLKSFK